MAIRSRPMDETGQAVYAALRSMLHETVSDMGADKPAAVMLSPTDGPAVVVFWRHDFEAMFGSLDKIGGAT